MLFSFSAIVQHTPYPPVGFSILKAGLNKSVLLSVYASGTARNNDDNPSQGFYFVLHQIIAISSHINQF